MKIPVFHPQIKVTLHKTVDRKQIADGAPVSGRFKGSARVIDITKYLGDSSSVRTSKSMRDPAGGFAIMVPDKPNGGPLGFETLYGLIEPMDFIEIRMLHGTGGATLPVVMRGFVSTVERSESIDGSGRPMRQVTISGQDYGKLWQQLQIIYRPGYIIGQDIISNFKLFERFGVGFQTSMKAADFVKEVVEKILNPYLKKLMPENTTNPTSIKMDTTVKHGTTSVTGPQNKEGTIYDLLRTYGDVGVWNELYLEDRDDGVYCVYRPNPFKTVAGKKIQDDAPEAEVIDLPGSDVNAFNVARSDANVANYYWVRAPIFEMVGEHWRKLYGITNDKKTVDLSEYENSDAKLYGVRLMEVDTMQGADDVKTFNSGEKEEDGKKRDTAVVDWVGDRRRILVEQNKDNVVLEQGVMNIRGNEKIRAGCFVRLKRGSFTAEYYVTRVMHEFAQYERFTTTLMFERGMGFVERAKREGGPDSPYLAELRGLK